MNTTKPIRLSGDQGSPLEWTDTKERWGLVGNGGALSTLGDLAGWDQALRAGAGTSTVTFRCRCR